MEIFPTNVDQAENISLRVRDVTPVRDFVFIDMSQGLLEHIPTEDSYTASISNTAYVEYILLLQAVREGPLDLLENLLSHIVKNNILDFLGS